MQPSSAVFAAQEKLRAAKEKVQKEARDVESKEWQTGYSETVSSTGSDALLSMFQQPAGVQFPSTGTIGGSTGARFLSADLRPPLKPGETASAGLIAALAENLDSTSANAGLYKTVRDANTPGPPEKSLSTASVELKTLSGSILGLGGPNFNQNVENLANSLKRGGLPFETISAEFLSRRFSPDLKTGFDEYMHALAAVFTFRGNVMKGLLTATCTEKDLSEGLLIENSIARVVSETDSRVKGPHGFIPGGKPGMGVIMVSRLDMSPADMLWAWSGGRVDVIILILVDVTHDTLDREDKRLTEANRKIERRRSAASTTSSAPTDASIKRDAAALAGRIMSRAVEALINAQFVRKRNLLCSTRAKLDIEKKIRALYEAIPASTRDSKAGLTTLLLEVDTFFGVSVIKAKDDNGKPLSYPNISKVTSDITIPIVDNAMTGTLAFNEAEMLFRDRAPVSVSAVMQVIIGSSSMAGAMLQGGSPLNVIIKQFDAILAAHKKGLESAFNSAAKEEAMHNPKLQSNKRFRGEKLHELSAAGKAAVTLAYNAKSPLSLTFHAAAGKKTATLSIGKGSDFSVPDYRTVLVNSRTFERDDNGGDLRIIVLLGNKRPFDTREPGDSTTGRRTEADSWGNKSRVYHSSPGDECLLLCASHLHNNRLPSEFLTHTSPFQITGSGHATFHYVRNEAPLYPGEEVPSIHRVLRNEGYGILPIEAQHDSREDSKKAVMLTMANLYKDLRVAVATGELKGVDQVKSLIGTHSLLGRLDPKWTNSSFHCPGCRATLNHLDLKQVLVKCSHPECQQKEHWFCGNREQCGQYLSVLAAPEGSGHRSAGGKCCVEGVCTHTHVQAKSAPATDRHAFICSACVTYTLESDGDSDQDKWDNLRDQVLQANPPLMQQPLPMRTVPPPRSEAQQDADKRNLENLKPSLRHDAAKRQQVLEQYKFNVIVDRHFPTAVSAWFDPGVRTLLAQTVYYETHKGGKVEPVAAIVNFRTNGASNSNMDKTAELPHIPKQPAPRVVTATENDPAQSLYLALLDHCGGGQRSTKVGLGKNPISASVKLTKLDPLLAYLFENDPLPETLVVKEHLRNLFQTVKGEDRLKAMKKLRGWELLLRASHEKEEKKHLILQQQVQNVAVNQPPLPPPLPPLPTAALPPPLPPPLQPAHLHPTGAQKKAASKVVRLAVNVSIARRVRHDEHTKKYNKPSDPPGYGEELTKHALELRMLIACSGFLRNLLYPAEAPVADVGEIPVEVETAESSAPSSSSSSSSAAPSNPKKRPREETKKEKSAAKKAKSSTDFEESGPSAKAFCNMVRTTDKVALKLVIDSLQGRIKQLRAKNAARLLSMHHVTALTLARSTGINSTVFLPPVEGWKQLLKRSTTGSYLHLAAPAKGVMILASKLLRFGSKLEAPDEAFTTVTCLNCRVIGKKSVNRTCNCTLCGLHTHRDITSTGNIAVRSLALGTLALRGLMVP